MNIGPKSNTASSMIASHGKPVRLSLPVPSHAALTSHHPPSEQVCCNRHKPQLLAFNSNCVSILHHF